MANITTQNWDGVTAPALPSGWTATGSNIVTSTTQAEGGSGNEVTQFTGTNGVVTLMYNAATDGNAGQCVVTSDFAIDSDSQDFYLFGRANAASGPTTFYYGRMQVTGSNNTSTLGSANAFWGFSVGKYVSGTPTALNGPTASGQLAGFTANTYYTAILTLNGTTVKLEIQRKSDSKWLTSAGAFQTTRVAVATATDSSVTGAGYAGIGWYKASATASAKVVYADAFSFDTLVATTYTVTAPIDGFAGVASDNFTVTPNGTYTGTITPSDGSSGGTFTPSSLTWSASSTPQTFTYTNATGGSYTISTTSSPALTDAASNVIDIYQSVSTQNWDGVTAPAIPSGWTTSGANIVTSTTQAQGTNDVTQFTGTSGVVTLMNNTIDTNSGNVQVRQEFAIDSDSQDIYLFARANAVSNPATFYYARLQITGLDNTATLGSANAFWGFSIGKYVSGTPTALVGPAAAETSAFSANTYYRMIFTLKGSALKVEVQRKSDNFWMTSSGTWQAARLAVHSVTDSSLTGSGYAGIGWYKASATASAKVIYSDNFGFYQLGSVAAATAFTMTGPGTAAINTPSSNFTVTPNGSYTGTITPSDSGAGGTFTPSSLSWTSDASAKTFTYTGVAAGSVTISATASPTLTPPSNLTVTITAPAVYYVAPTGNDSNNGTSTSTPFKTVAKVNSLSLNPGDSVFFQGGQTFPGSLTLNVAGSASKLITVSSYGVGVATINAGDSNGTALGGGGAGDGWGIRITNSSYLTVSMLKAVGSGVVLATGVCTSGSTNGTQSPSNNTVGVGLDIISNTNGTSNYKGVTISNVEITGFYEGCYVRCEPTTSSTVPDAYENLSITNVSIHDCLHFGIYTYGGNSASKGGSPFFFYNNFGAVKNGYIADTTVYNVPGDPFNTVASGVMMQLNNWDGGLVDRCVVHDGTSLVGRLNDNYASFSSGGGGGIIPLECRNVVVQHCEAYNLTTGLRYDACGFDIDISTVGCIMQFNYSHDNYGPGFQCGTNGSNTPTPSGNVFRYNISSNDCRNPKNNPSGQGGQAALRNFGGSVGAVFHNNTVYLPHNSATAQPYCFEGDSSSDANKVYNNIFITEGGAMFCAAQANDVFRGNLYWSTTSQPKWSNYAGTTYTTLAAFQAAGTTWEMNGAATTGMLADPKVSSIGDHATLGLGTPPYLYHAYDLLSTSPAINAALGLLQFSISPASSDIHGASVPTGNFPDIGAMEYGATGGYTASSGGGGGGGGSESMRFGF